MRPSDRPSQVLHTPWAGLIAAANATSIPRIERISIDPEMHFPSTPFDEGYLSQYSETEYCDSSDHRIAVPSVSSRTASCVELFADPSVYSLPASQTLPMAWRLDHGIGSHYMP